MRSEEMRNKEMGSKEMGSKEVTNERGFIYALPDIIFGRTSVSAQRL